MKKSNWWAVGAGINTLIFFAILWVNALGGLKGEGWIMVGVAHTILAVACVLSWVESAN